MLPKVHDLKPTPLFIVIGFASTFIMSVMRSCSIVHADAFHGISCVWSGLCAGSCIWLGSVAPVTVGREICEKKPRKLWLQNIGYWLTTLLVTMVIVVVWRQAIEGASTKTYAKDHQALPLGRRRPAYDRLP